MNKTNPDILNQQLTRCPFGQVLGTCCVRLALRLLEIRLAIHVDGLLNNNRLSHSLYNAMHISRFTVFSDTNAK